MGLKNNWVGYVERGYYDIKQSILNRVKTSVPEITDFTESNIFVIIISIFAGLIEQVNYYIDQLMRESFLPTARRYTSAVNLTRIIDYRIKAANPASTDLTVTLLDGNDDPFNIQYGQSELIPEDTEIIINGLPFIVTKDITIQYPFNQGLVPVAQFELNEESFNITNSGPNMVFGLGTDYVHNSMAVVINGTTWDLVTTFGRSTSTDTHFIVDIKADGIAYLQFGDGINGAIPVNGDSVVLSWKKTSGPGGNLVAQSINEISDTLVNLTYATKLQLVNYNNITSGAAYENLERIKTNAPLSLRTLDRAVTRQDYIDVAKMHPGVNKANIQYTCGKYVELFISPMGGGIASTALLDAVTAYFDDYRMITTFVNIRPTGESQIVLSLEITGRPRMKSQDIVAQVKPVLLEEYGYDKSDVNRAIRVSDIYALVDNQEMVDYVNIKNLYLIPYFFPVNYDIPLNKVFTLIGTNTKLTFRLIFVSGTTFHLYRSGDFETAITTGSEYDNGLFKITPQAGTYDNSSIWEFTIYPAKKDIELSDYSIPILEDGNLTLSIKEVLV